MKKILLVALMIVIPVCIFAATAEEQWMAYGDAMYAEKDFPKASMAYDNVIKLNQQNYMALLKDGYCNYFMKDYGKAADCLERADAIQPNPKIEAFAARLRQAAPASGAAAAAASSSAAGEEPIKIMAYVFGGFTTASMGVVNYISDSNITSAEKLFDTEAEDYGLPTPAFTSSKQDFGPGFIFGAKAGFAVIPNLYAGPKIEYIGLTQEKTAYQAQISNFDGMGDSLSYNFSGTQNASLIPVMAGAVYSCQVPGIPLHIDGELGLGWGFASAGYNNTASATYSGPNMSGFTPNTINDSNNLQGTTFVTEISLKANYDFNQMLSAGLTLGYRVANVSQMTFTADNAADGIKKGDVYTTNTGSPTSPTGSATSTSGGTPIAYDFSGFIIGAQFTLNF